MKLSSTIDIEADIRDARRAHSKIEEELAGIGLELLTGELLPEQGLPSSSKRAKLIKQRNSAPALYVDLSLPNLLVGEYEPVVIQGNLTVCVEKSKPAFLLHAVFQEIGFKICDAYQPSPNGESVPCYLLRPLLRASYKQSPETIVKVVTGIDSILASYAPLKEDIDEIRDSIDLRAVVLNSFKTF